MSRSSDRATPDFGFSCSSRDTQMRLLSALDGDDEQTDSDDDEFAGLTIDDPEAEMLEPGDEEDDEQIEKQERDFQDMLDTDRDDRFSR